RRDRLPRVARCRLRDGLRRPRRRRRACRAQRMIGRPLGRVALVTGAGRGIGRAIALDLARNGAAVAAVGRDGNRLERLVSELSESGARAYPVRADLTKRDEIDAAVASAVEAFGSLDAVVNNAGVSTERGLDEESL